MNIGRDVMTIVKAKTPSMLDKELTTAITKGIEKSIRPTVVGKRTASQMKNYFDRAKTAVKTIIENKDNLMLSDAEGGIVKGLPKTIKQFSEAIEQTKRSVFKQYDDMARTAGGKGVEVDLSPAVRELESLGGNKVLTDMSPEIAEYALKRAEALSSRGVYTTAEAQDAITHLNKSLESFYKNPSYETANRAGVDALIVNNIRKSLDNAIEGAAGQGYQDLKRTYGALKALEKDVSHRAVVDARKNAKGLLDFTDVLTSGELLGGLLTMNPTMAATGFFGRMVKGFYKRLNDPNRTVKGMFADAEAIINRKPVRAADMRSATGRAVGAFLSPADETITAGTGRMGPIPAGANAERGLGPVRSGIAQGEPYGPSSARLVSPKQLPAGQGFELRQSDIIDVPFTSRERPTLRLPDAEQRSAPKLLPAGQGFELVKQKAATDTVKQQAKEAASIETWLQKNKAMKGTPMYRENEAAAKIAKQKMTTGGPQGVIGYIKEMGGMDLSRDYRQIGEYPDLKRVHKKGAKGPDEWANILKDEGFVGFDSGDDLVEMIKEGKARNIFTPEKRDAKIQSQIRKLENENIANQLATLAEKEGIDARAAREILPTHQKRLIDEITTEGLIDPANEEAALKEISDFFGSAAKPSKKKPKVIIKGNARLEAPGNISMSGKR
ncbi:MAG: hypothetical protein WC637_00020 [Victivallales bacterium]